MSTTGQHIKELRTKLGLTQKKLAEKVGLTYVQIGRYEKRGAVPSSEVLNKLADALDTTTDYLMNGATDEKAKATLKNADLLQKFKEIESMPDKEQISITNVINAYIRDYKTRQAYSA